MLQCVVCKTELTAKQKKYCSNNCKAKDHYPNRKKQPNTTWVQYKRGYARKLFFLSLYDYKCSECGYKKNMAALEFHHERDKSIKLDVRSFSGYKMETLIEEVKKCVILCSRCHAEHHCPEGDLELRLAEFGDEVEKVKELYCAIAQGQSDRFITCRP